ncbi:ZNF852 isoform 3 [Pongo abelii]|uniref:ZNF852 isoform 3 n=1 Tax=Pongo abelii TaxID=9601 RepID=A0A2J8WXJ7_PONAB|nr:ZNF852 isoform 3 [Pongo abelii]
MIVSRRRSRSGEDELRSFFLTKRGVCITPALLLWSGSAGCGGSLHCRRLDLVPCFSFCCNTVVTLSLSYIKLTKLAGHGGACL